VTAGRLVVQLMPPAVIHCTWSFLARFCMTTSRDPVTSWFPGLVMAGQPPRHLCAPDLGCLVAFHASFPFFSRPELVVEASGTAQCAQRH
jgi:hypothetical protein